MQNIKAADARDARVDPKTLHGPFRLTQLTDFVGGRDDGLLHAMVGLQIPGIGWKVREARLTWTEDGYRLFPPSSKLRGIEKRYAITWNAQLPEMVELAQWVATIYLEMTHAGKTRLVDTTA